MEPTEGGPQTLLNRLTGPPDPVQVLKTAPNPAQWLVQQVAIDLRWSFTPPWTWLTGVAANLVLSLLWLLYDPLIGQPHRDWAVLVGTYFSVFVLADVTTTNVLGADSLRVRLSLLRRISLRRVLLVKNLTLLIIVGVPTLLATAAITVHSEAGYRLALTLPGVTFPILTWLGVGNVVSVLLPVAPVRLRQRWEQRRSWRPTVRWLFHLGLPYGLYFLVAPVSRLPRVILQSFRAIFHTTASRGVVLVGTGLVLWMLGTEVALLIARHRSVRFDDSWV